MAELRVEDMSVWAGPTRLVDGADFSVGSGELAALIGPNGAGKSSLLRGIIGLGERVSGGAFIDGQAVSAMKPHARARMMSYLPQSLPLAWPIRVYDAVALGRYPHGTDRDGHGIIARALADCDLLALADRTTDSLSGGELARVHVARTFATQAPILLIDEPVAALDPYHALSVMQLLRAHADAGAAVVVVLHDLALAARFASRIIGMRGERICVGGAPEQVVTPENIAMLFDVTVAVTCEAGWPQPTIMSALRLEGDQRS
ncbi:MAG: ABC transporter ATP-binding protein [Sphingopyxis sp.]